jgi:membrane-bound ClpP family serine protease
MWAVAGVLLGLVLLASIVGFHAGPHSHVFAGVLGAVTAIWLFAMALSGQSAPLLWALLSADLVLSAGVGTAAYKGIRSERAALTSSKSTNSLAGKLGVALSDLTPDGLVRVGGETWSATSLNGNVKNGDAVQVIEFEGVRLKVWGEEVPSIGIPPLVLDDAEESTGTTTDAAAAESD